MITGVTIGHMFINIDQPRDENFNPDFFLHFAVQSGKDPFPMLNLAARHDPHPMKGLHAAAGEKNTIVGIDDTGND